MATLAWNTQTLSSRVVRAIRLDGELFREVAADRGATFQALLVVLLAGAATAAAGGGTAVPTQLFLAYMGWITGALLTYVISRYVFRVPGPRVGWSAIARATGFAHAPVLLRVAGVLPGISAAMQLLTLAWQGLVMLVAVRNAVGYPSYWQPVGIVAIGFVPYAIVTLWFSLLLL